jgi:hypothetical protein
MLAFSECTIIERNAAEAGKQNVPLAEAMALTGHRSVQTAVRYFQTGAVENAKAANLLTGTRPKSDLWDLSFRGRHFGR